MIIQFRFVCSYFEGSYPGRGRANNDRKRSHFPLNTMCTHAYCTIKAHVHVELIPCSGVRQ